jgi:hypothetical protein
MLDQGTLATLMSGGSGDYGDALAKIYAMGGDAKTAADEFIADVESGLPYEQVKKSFDEAVAKGAYNIDTDTADEVKKSVLNALANKQKGGGNASLAKAAKELGFPELAFLAPTIGQQAPASINPYSVESENEKKYSSEIKALQENKLEETGVNKWLKRGVKSSIAGLGGLLGGALGTLLPTGATTVAGAGLGATTGLAVADRILPDSPDLKRRKEEQKKALMTLQQNLRSAGTTQNINEGSWQRGYDQAIKKSGTSLLSPFELTRLQMMQMLKSQG